MHVYATVFWYQLVDLFPEDCKRIKYSQFEKLYITREMNDTFFERPHRGYEPDGPIRYETEVALVYEHYYKMAEGVLRSFVSSKEHQAVYTIVLLNQTTLPTVLIDYIKSYL